MKNIAILTFFIIFLITLMIYVGNDFFILFQSNSESQSIGSVSNGKLAFGKRLPSSGNNFVTYSRLGSLIGRNGVHHKVHRVITESFDKLYQDYPVYRYMIGEASWLSGGSIKPHKTHQNGLSVDFMVPIINNENQIDILPTHIFNKFGYDIEFDSEGKTTNFKIDFESITTHIFYLYKSCVANNIEIDLVIFDPELQKILFETKYGSLLKDKIQFSKTPVWVRHDEHYHINFKL